MKLSELIKMIKDDCQEIEIIDNITGNALSSDRDNSIIQRLEGEVIEIKSPDCMQITVGFCEEGE